MTSMIFCPVSRALCFFAAHLKFFHGMAAVLAPFALCAAETVTPVTGENMGLPIANEGAAGAPGDAAPALSAASSVLPAVTIRALPIIQGDKLDPYAATAAVVTRQQIADLNAMDFGFTLRTVPGVTVSRRNVVGSYGGSCGGAVFIRGLGVSRPGAELATLYDGVPRYNSTFSHPLLDLLSVDAAHAMHIYKGPQPQIFGNAFVAIAIEPRHVPPTFVLKPVNVAPGDGFGGDIGVAYGTDDTVVQAANVAARFGDTSLFLGQSFQHSSGNRPNSGGELQDYNAHLSHELGKNWTASLTFDHTNNHAEDPGPMRGATLSASPPVVWPYHQGNYCTQDSITVLTFTNHLDEVEGFIKPYWHHGSAMWRNQNPGPKLASPPVPAGVDDRTKDTGMNWDNYGVRFAELVRPSEGSELTVGFDYDVQTVKVHSNQNDGDVNRSFRRKEFQVYSPYAAISHVLGNRAGFYAQPSAGMRFYAHNYYASETAPHAGLVLGYKDTARLPSMPREACAIRVLMSPFSPRLFLPLQTTPALPHEIPGTRSKQRRWNIMKSASRNSCTLRCRSVSPAFTTRAAIAT